jgi:DNA-3-methyladenine glycosylase
VGTTNRYATLPLGFFRRPSKIVAPELLGRYLVRELEGERLVVRIVEVEAYLGAEDRASHAWNDRRTRRTESLFRDGGSAYVYLIYGMYHCLNVVTGSASDGGAVLIRAAASVEGAASMAANRGLTLGEGPVRGLRPGQLAGGPGKLCQALRIGKDFDRAPLTSGDLRLVSGEPVAESAVAVGPRIGVDYAGAAKAWPLRFAADGDSEVSRPYPWS